jgi:hypothetical protein
MPVEILTSIGSELADDRRDLARLALTCRRISKIVITALYLHIEDRKPHRLREVALAVSLADHPSRGEAIRSIQLAAPLFEAFAGCDPKTAEAFRRIVMDLFGPDAWDQTVTLEPIKMMAVVCLAPNLSTLEFAITHWWGDTNFLLETVNNQVTGPKLACTLPKLTNLTVRFRFATTTVSGTNLQSLDGLLHAATGLESLTVERPCGGTSLTARLPRLTTLRLVDSYLCPRGLRLLTQSCPNLAHFELTNHGRHPVESCLPASPAQVLERLAPCRGTLQRLHLAPWIDPPIRDGRPYPLLTKLGGFTALKQVAVDYWAISPRADDEKLARLVWDCPLLEELSLFSVEAFTIQEFAAFAHATAVLCQW